MPPLRQPFSPSPSDLPDLSSPPPAPSRSSTTPSTASTSCSTSSHCYDSFLMPDTFVLPESSQTDLKPLSHTQTRSSSWDVYLMETSQHVEGLEVDKAELRHEILSAMKQYYGNKKWERVETFESTYDYISDEACYQPYTDQIIMYGEDDNWFRRCKYYDRRGFQVPRHEFEKRKMAAPEGQVRPSFMRRVRSRLAREP